MYKYCTCLIVAGICILSKTSAQSTVVSPQDKKISYEGRILFTSNAAQLMWPGTAIRINFEGTAIAGQFKDADTSNYYDVITDGTSNTLFHFDTTKKTYILANNLPAGKHSLEIYKRTEWDKGKTWFYGFELNKGTSLLRPSRLPERKMEIFGNSITCGYAINDNTGDSPTGYYQDCYNAYGAITARHFNAQCHLTAKSGIGIMLSWFPLIMPEMYNRTDPTDSTSKWDFSVYTPGLVVINLFQNDSWLIKQPNHTEFKHRFGSAAPGEAYIVNAYKNFVQTIRGKYPKAQIICMLGNMDITRNGSPWAGYIQKATEQLNDPRIFTYFAAYKNTPGHPKVAEQKILADGLIKFIEAHIKW
jgi:hypothetical protein